MVTPGSTQFGCEADSPYLTSVGGGTTGLAMVTAQGGVLPQFGNGLELRR